MCKSTGHDTVQDTGSRLCAEMLPLALDSAAMSRTAVPALRELSPLLGWDPYPYSAASLNGKNPCSTAWLTPLPSPINKTSEPNWVSFYWLDWLLAEGPLLGPSWRGPGTNEITENHKSVLWPHCSHVFLLAKGLPSIPITLPQQPTHMGTFNREGGSGWGIHVTPWLIHVNVWQDPLQCCEVISLQLIKINEKKRATSSLCCDQLCPTLCNPMDYTPPGSSAHGSSRQEYWSQLLFPSPRDLPTQGSNPHLQCLLHRRQILHHCDPWGAQATRCPTLNTRHPIPSHQAPSMSLPLCTRSGHIQKKQYEKSQGNATA